MPRHWPAVWLAVSLSALIAVSAGADPADTYFKLKLQTGERYADIFSKAISVKGAGFDEIVRRVSGTAEYRVTNPNPETPAFTISYRYDGRPTATSALQLRSGGESCYDGKCAVDDSTSGLAFNPLLWGTPPAELKVGLTWKRTIAQPWEAGPPGNETVRVVSLDPINHMVMLEREGSGAGASDDDQNKLPIVVNGKAGTTTVTAGPSRWSGQTLFCDGIVVSDEILVERHVTLQSDLGKFEGEEREYTLLNAMSVEGDGRPRS